MNYKREKMIAAVLALTFTATVFFAMGMILVRSLNH